MGSCRTKLDYAGRDIRVIESGSFNPGDTIYAADEVLSGLLTFANVGTCDPCNESVSASAGYGEVLEMKLIESGGTLQMSDIDVLLFSASFTPPAPHTAWPVAGSIAGLDPKSFLGRFSFSGYEQFGTDSAAIVLRSGDAVKLPAHYYATSLYALMISKGTPTYTDETGMLELVLTIVKQ